MTHDYELTSVKVMTFSGYASVSSAMKAAAKWLKRAEKESAWGLVVMGIHTYSDEDGLCDLTITVEHG